MKGKSILIHQILNWPHKTYLLRLHINGKKHPLNATLREINEVIEAITNQVGF